MLRISTTTQAHPLNKDEPGEKCVEDGKPQCFFVTLAWAEPLEDLGAPRNATWERDFPPATIRPHVRQ